MADHDVAEENNADGDQSVEAEEERRVIFIIIIMETVHEVYVAKLWTFSETKLHCFFIPFLEIESWLP